MHVWHARVYEAMTINIDGNGTKSLFINYWIDIIVPVFSVNINDNTSNSLNSVVIEKNLLNKYFLLN
jgi:hypothetical protein